MVGAPEFQHSEKMSVNGRRICSEKFMFLVIPAGTLGFDGTKTLSLDIFELGKVEEAYRLKAVPESHRHQLTQLPRSST